MTTTYHLNGHLCTHRSCTHPVILVRSVYSLIPLQATFLYNLTIRFVNLITERSNFSIVISTIDNNGPLNVKAKS